MHPAHNFVKGTCVIFQPLAHIYGGAMLTVSLCLGGCAVLMPKFSLEEYLKLVEKYRVGISNHYKSHLIKLTLVSILRESLQTFVKIFVYISYFNGCPFT